MMRQLGIHAQLYDYLERSATDEQRKQGLDIADFLLDIETDEGKLEQMRLTNQSIDKLINQLQLQPVKQPIGNMTDGMTDGKRKGLRL